MKHRIIHLLQAMLGYQKYLHWFTVFKVKTLRLDKRKQAYLAFVKNINPQDNVLIIGANTGITTVPIAKKAFAGVVYAVEPFLPNYQTLQTIKRKFGLMNLVTIHTAAGHKNENTLMAIPIIKGVKSHGLVHQKSNEIKGYPQEEVFEINMRKIDDMVELNKPIQYIKLVAENAELPILQGAQKLLEQHQPSIYCELWDSALKPKVIQFIKSMNYEVYAFQKTGLQLYNETLHHNKFFLFTPKPH